MSIASKRNKHDLSVSYCRSYSRTESESSDSESSEEYVGSESPKNRAASKIPIVTLDSTQEVADTDISSYDLTPAASGTKRKRSTDCSGASRDSESRSVSPEIPYTGSPVKYQITKVNGTLIISKKSMSTVPNSRPQKCTELDIAGLLDEDSDDEIFKAKRRIDAKRGVTRVTDSRCSLKEVGSPSKAESLKREEGALKLTLRRSTEQSNYKIQQSSNIEDAKYRTSGRSTKGTPKKCGMADCDEDHSVHGILRRSKSPNKAEATKNGTPSKRTRRNSKSEALTIKSIHNKENKTEDDNNGDEEIEGSSEQGVRKSSPKREFGTPAKQSKKFDDIETPKSARGRRQTRLVNDDHETLASTRNESHEVMERNGTPVKKIVPSTPRSVTTRRSTRLLSSDDVRPEYRECGSDDDNTPKSARARRSTRLVSYREDDNEDTEGKNNASGGDADAKNSRGSDMKRLAAKSGVETPRKQQKKEQESGTPSSRTRRKSKLVNYNYDGGEIAGILEDEGNLPNDAMKQEEESPPRRSSSRLSMREGSATPNKRNKLLGELTPKRTPRRATMKKINEESPPTPRSATTKNIDEEPSKTPRRATIKNIDEEPSKTPRRATIKNIDEEPSKTPRRATIKNIDEEPPKTPRRATIKNIDEKSPKTPTTASRRISKATTPSLIHGSLTPSMSRRTANVGKPKTILEEARAQLHVSAVPSSMPCREEEFNDIYEFLERKLVDNNSGCIYISGVPGTGKTATVNEAIRCLKKLALKGTLKSFDYIEINGMKLSEPRQAYVQILKQVNGQTATWEQAHQILEKRFTRSTVKRPMTLLLVDELDLLCNKRQDVVYNLLDWPAKANAQLVVITIANTMDLPERVLMGRVTSRLGLTRLTFQPYNHKQLQEIVMARLKDSEAFKSEAIQLVARKVAAVSGDARRALDICRRATEIAEVNGGKIVTMKDVNQALTEMVASAKVRAIKQCSHMERIFLQAVCAEVTRTGVEEANFQNVYRQFDALSSFEGLKVPNISQALGICARLGGNRLLLCEHSRHDIHQRILLNVSSDDIHFAMNVA